MMGLGEREWVTIVRGDSRRFHWNARCPKLDRWPWRPPEAFPWHLPPESRRQPCFLCSGSLKARTFARLARRRPRPGARPVATRRAMARLVAEAGGKAT